jgi:hypothetical protein
LLQVVSAWIKKQTFDAQPEVKAQLHFARVSGLRIPGQVTAQKLNHRLFGNLKRFFGSGRDEALT